MATHDLCDSTEIISVERPLKHCFTQGGSSPAGDLVLDKLQLPREDPVSATRAIRAVTFIEQGRSSTKPGARTWTLFRLADPHLIGWRKWINIHHIIPPLIEYCAKRSDEDWM
ncbi:MAG: hypothetical protein ACJATG_002144, partial [Dinoroseobacter sp.]